MIISKKISRVLYYTLLSLSEFYYMLPRVLEFDLYLSFSKIIRALFVFTFMLSNGSNLLWAVEVTILTSFISLLSNILFKG